MGLAIVQSKGVPNPLNIAWLIHGVKYVGKSTLFSVFPDVLYITTERRHDHIVGISYIFVKDWEELLRATKYLNTDGCKKKYKFIVFDVIDTMYQYAINYKSDKKKWEDGWKTPGWGKGEDMVDALFRPWYINLLTLPYGFGFISHTKVEQIEKSVKEGDRIITKIVPDVKSGLHKRAKAIVLPPIAITGHMKFEDMIVNNKIYKNVRIISFVGSDTIEAGDGLGVMPKRMIVPKDLSKVYPMIERYFNKVKIGKEGEP